MKSVAYFAGGPMDGLMQTQRAGKADHTIVFPLALGTVLYDEPEHYEQARYRCHYTYTGVDYVERQFYVYEH